MTPDGSCLIWQPAARARRRFHGSAEKRKYRRIYRRGSPYAAETGGIHLLRSGYIGTRFESIRKAWLSGERSMAGGFVLGGRGMFETVVFDVKEIKSSARKAAYFRAFSEVWI